MRNIFKHILFFVIITVFVGVSCKKYPDGPLINFETKMHRIAGNGTKTWDVAFFSVNGYDSTSNLLAQSYYGKYVFHSKKDRNPLRFFVISNNGNYYSGGSWNFNTKKNYIDILQSDNNIPQFNTNPYIASNVNWEIRRLTDNDLWLKTIFSGKEYFMKLKH